MEEDDTWVIAGKSEVSESGSSDQIRKGINSPIIRQKDSVLAEARGEGSCRLAKS